MNPASKQRPSESQEQTGTPPSSAPANEWEERLFRNSYTRGGQRFFLEGWSVKIQHQGRRRTFSLGTVDKVAAAAKAKAIYENIVTRGWEAVARERVSRSATAQTLMSPGENIWRERLLVRRYRFPPSEEAENDLSVKIDHEGVGYWFPLKTSNPPAAGQAADRIFSNVLEQGWPAVCREFSRELIVGFEWCSNPILWTYTTIHTLVTGPAEPSRSAADPNVRRVLVVESDAGIRRALQWCINQPSEFQAIACDSPEEFLHAFAVHKPQLVLLNRNLAERIGFGSPGRVAAIQRNIPALTYSVAVDGDHLFVSTPGGADGYLLRRVAPAAVLEPIAGIPARNVLTVEEIDRSVKSYFKDSLLPRPRELSGAIARLTARELEVLGLLGKGCVDKEIAQALGISAWTVHGHIKKIFERLGVRTRTEAVVLYLEK